MFIIDRGYAIEKGKFRYELYNKDGKHIDSSDILSFIQMMYGPNIPVRKESTK